MGVSFGLDHPLIAVHDLAALRDRLGRIGFRMTPIGRHPWGTSTTLAMFQDCLIECVGIYDEGLLSVSAVPGFAFGAHVHRHLAQTEGIALTALHSTDIAADCSRAVAAGRSVAGRIDFGRDVTLPDGTVDRTSTSLAILPDPDFSRLSFFLCQQHRPDLIYVPEWLEHHNTACGLAGMTIVAHRHDLSRVARTLTPIFGTPFDGAGAGLRFQTGNGTLTVAAVDDIAGTPLAAAIAAAGPDALPRPVCLDIACRDLEMAAACVAEAGFSYTVDGDLITLADPTRWGRTVLRFRAQPPSA